MNQLNAKAATRSQVDLARKYQAQHKTMSLSQAIKYLEYITAFKRGQLTAEAFEKATGHKAEFSN